MPADSDGVKAIMAAFPGSEVVAQEQHETGSGLPDKARPEEGAIASWLDEVYGQCPGYVSMFALPGRWSQFYKTDDLDTAAACLARHAKRQDVYVGCATLTRPVIEGRGRAGDTLALAGLWADIDVAGAAHASTVALPDEPTALALLDDLGVLPTAVIHSGHGYQAWWLFDHPIIFGTTDGDREVAEDLLRRWGATLVEIGRRRGVHVDNVSDLARVLRPPGTINRKLDPVPVRLIQNDPASRFEPAFLSRHCMTIEPPSFPSTGTVTDRTTPRRARYGQGALERELGRLLMAPVGTRNSQLNRSAFALGQLIAGGELNFDLVAGQLYDAAVRIGLGDTEAKTTIASGLREGLKTPRRQPVPA
jgi:hypothetical protein